MTKPPVSDRDDAKSADVPGPSIPTDKLGFFIVKLREYEGLNRSRDKKTLTTR